MKKQLYFCRKNTYKLTFLARDGDRQFYPWRWRGVLPIVHVGSFLPVTVTGNLAGHFSMAPGENIWLFLITENLTMYIFIYICVHVLNSWRTQWMRKLKILGVTNFHLKVQNYKILHCFWITNRNQYFPKPNLN